ncbi:hypothetical protein L1987_32662 [Smallanthus sonchifolius]|uniref:Uncharacterized protein n=1 Tax=Smallanthus sonchifolius TaxID=185202 RepID=A0ACB9HQK0_9ASTR|nr:hypothetical protein L1987_32662 [Smallanthus sonchifolius]
MDLALDATTTVGVDLGQGLREVDIKKYIKVEKIPGGQLEDSKVLKGVMFNKDVVVPGKMKRKICPYEAAAVAFEAIPRTLAQNCGVNVIRTMTALQGKASYLFFSRKVLVFSLSCFLHVNELHL